MLIYISAIFKNTIFNRRGTFIFITKPRGCSNQVHSRLYIHNFTYTPSPFFSIFNFIHINSFFFIFNFINILTSFIFNLINIFNLYSFIIFLSFIFIILISFNTIYINIFIFIIFYFNNYFYNLNNTTAVIITIIRVNFGNPRKECIITTASAITTSANINNKAVNANCCIIASLTGEAERNDSGA